MLSDAPLCAVLPVSDMERAKRFYQDTLGLKLVSDAGGGTLFESGGARFSLYETPLGAQAEHTLAAWDVTDLAAEMSELRGRGIVFEEYDLPGLKTADGVAEMGVVRGCWFKDSEGNTIALVEGMPK